MIGKLKSLAGAIQNRFNRPPPPAKPAGMPTADAFVAGDRSATVRAEGAKMLKGLSHRAPLEELAAAAKEAEGEARMRGGEAPPALTESTGAAAAAVGVGLGQEASELRLAIARRSGTDVRGVGHVKVDPDAFKDDPLVNSPGSPRNVLL